VISDHKVVRAILEHKELPALRVSKDGRESLDPQALRVQPGFLAFKDLRVTTVLPAQRVIKAILEIQAHRDRQDRRAQQERRGFKASRVSKVSKAFKASKEILGLQVFRAIKGLKGSKGFKAQQVRLDPWVLLVRMGQQDLKDRQDP